MGGACPDSAATVATMKPLRDEPSALALIAECRRILAQTVTPALSGDARVAALMVASALGIAERELTDRTLDAALAGPSEAAHLYDEAALVAAIRAGRLDADAGLHQSLLAAGRARLRVAKPQALDAPPRP